MQSDHSPISGPRFDPLGRYTNSSERGAVGQSNVTISVFTDASLAGWGGTCEFQVVGGVWPPPLTMHIKRIGAPHCVESGPTLCHNVYESTRNDSHGQQGDSSIHKSPGGRALGTAAGHSETAVMLGAHALALHQSSVHPRCPEQRGCTLL